MRQFWLISALFFTLVSCASTEESKVEDYSCEKIFEYIYADTADRLLLEACFSSEANKCLPEDSACLHSIGLKCQRDAMAMKIEEIDAYLKNECDISLDRLE